MENIIIDTLWSRAKYSDWFIRAKGLPEKNINWETNIFYWIEDIDKHDFNKDYRFIITWLDSWFKLLYVVNTNEFYTNIRKTVSGKNKYMWKEYTISSGTVEWFKWELKNFLIVNWILMD